MIPHDYKISDAIAKSPKGLSTVIERGAKK
jgi:hypothetical protein